MSETEDRPLRRKRRVKCFCMSRDFLHLFPRVGAFEVVSSLPAGARIHFGGQAPHRDAFIYFVEHESFDEIPECTEAPVIENPWAIKLVPMTRPMTLEEARTIAAQCWTDDSTKDIEMDSRLAEAFARRLCEHAAVVVRTPYYAAPEEISPPAEAVPAEREGA